MKNSFSPLISVKEAKKLLGRSDVIFVDTRNYWKYSKGHIPEARNLELYAFHWADTSKAGMKLFSRQMARLFASLGIDNTKQVVFYQNNSGYDAARGVWLSSFLGHKRAAMLDGGLNKWKREGLALSTKDPGDFKRGKFVPRIDRSVIATFDNVSKDLKGASDSKIIDVRSQGEYNGKYRRAFKVGHVPNAINLEWSQSLRRDGTLKSQEVLQRMFQTMGLSEENEIITYCQSGYRAAHTWLVLKMLGFRVRNYLGSWYEWGNSPSSIVDKSS